MLWNNVLGHVIYPLNLGLVLNKIIFDDTEQYNLGLGLDKILMLLTKY